MAFATSGNGLELLHSKAVPHWWWAAFWAALAVAMFYIPGVNGVQAWLDTEFGRVIYSIICGITALLPLVSRTGRMFVQMLQWWFPAYAVVLWLGPAFDAATTGRWALAVVHGLGLLGAVALLMFRKQFFLSGFVIGSLLCFSLSPAVDCVDYETVRSAHFKTFNECAASGYETVAPILWLIGFFVLILIGRKFANDALAR